MSRDSANTFTVMSERTCEQLQKMIRDNFEKNKYTVYSWHNGETPHLGQKQLLHVWLRLWIAHHNRIAEDEVSKEHMEAWKLAVKMRYYAATGAAFMVKRYRDPKAPDGLRLEYTSVKDWTPGQCFQVMEWMQLKAAEQGLILESKGEFLTNKQASIG